MKKEPNVEATKMSKLQNVSGTVTNNAVKSLKIENSKPLCNGTLWWNIIKRGKTQWFSTSSCVAAAAQD